MVLSSTANSTTQIPEMSVVHFSFSISLAEWLRPNDSLSSYSSFCYYLGSIWIWLLERVCQGNDKIMKVVTLVSHVQMSRNDKQQILFPRKWNMHQYCLFLLSLVAEKWILSFWTFLLIKYFCHFFEMLQLYVIVTLENNFLNHFLKTLFLKKLNLQLAEKQHSEVRCYITHISPV